MFRLRKSRFIGTIFICLCLFFSCTNYSDTTEFVVGFSQCTGDDAWRKQMLADMRTELEFHNNIKFIYLDAKGNNSIQIAQLKELVKQKIDLLIVTPNEADPITPIVDEIYKNKIPVIVVDRKTNSGFYSAYVGADNYEIGQFAGLKIAQLLNGKGSILEIWGLQGSTPAIERHKGLIDALKNYKQIEIKQQIYGKWEMDVVSKELQSNHIHLDSIDLIFAHNDVMAYSAYQYMLTNYKEKLKSIKFIGVDGLSGNGNGLELVNDNILNATFLYPTGGEEAIRLAVRILKGEEVEKENKLHTTVIDSKNIRIMKMQTEKILNQQKDVSRLKDKIIVLNEKYYDQRNITYLLVFFLLAVIVLSLVAIKAWIDKTVINRKLERQKDEVLHQKNKISEMAEVAEKSNQEKLNFFTNISHEFKTPLTLILGPIEELMTDKEMSKNEIKRVLITIKRNTIRLLRLINQLMDFRKIESENLNLKVSEQDISKFIKNLIFAFYHLAKQRKIDFNFHSDPEHITVWFDPDFIDKVVFNILSNAFKFTPDGGKIKIEVTKDSNLNEIYIKFSDNGQGMNEEEIQNIFNRYYSGKDNTQLGTGLGLALSKELVELHGGQIKVFSQRQIGTIFTIILPLGNAHLPKESIAFDEVKHVSNYNYEFLIEESEELSIENSKAETAPEKTILIIDDNKELIDYLSRRLGKYYLILSTTNSQEGLNMILEQIPDLIISDLVMPYKSGFEITSIIKSDKRTSHIPIILLTAKSDMEQKIKGIQIGADIYITKPFAFDYLLEGIKAIFRNREILKNHYNNALDFDSSLIKPGSLDKKFINDFTGLINKKLSNPELNVNEIAFELGMSRIQLYRKVKALLDCSVNDYIVDLRIKKAKQLIKNTEMTLSEIAYETGFSSPAYFSTTFKNKTNLSPSDFKNISASEK